MKEKSETALSPKAPSEFERLIKIMSRLRDPLQGCPWDLEQNFQTIVPHTLEEAYEVADAIQNEDYGALKGELGDLLFQVIFYAQLAKERGYFDIQDVIKTLNIKMIERHPHVFSTEKIATAVEQSMAWEEHKSVERLRQAESEGRTETSALDGIARSLPALTRAEKLQKRAARVGFDWPNISGVIEKIDEELTELKAEILHDASIERLQDELGDLILSCVNLARHLKLDAEETLRHANTKFESRFRRLERVFQKRNAKLEEATLDEMERVWHDIKQKNVL